MAVPAGAQRKNYGGDEAVREHHLRRAQGALDFRHEGRPCGDERKALIALAIKRENTVPQDWIVSQLHMGTRSAVSRVAALLAKPLSNDNRLRKLYNAIIKNAI